jgi:quinol monooxygenase YgiN
MSQVTNLAFFRARRGQSEALGAALAALVEPTRLEAGCLNYDLHRSVDDTMSGLFTRTGVRLKVLKPTCWLSTCRHF